MLAAEPRRELQEAMLAMLGPQPTVRRPTPRMAAKRGPSRVGLIVLGAVGIPLATSAAWAGAALIGMLAH